MPYTEKQCKAFAVKEKMGGKPPADWKKHCKKAKQVKRNSK
jgi:hypothetical protein